MRTARLTLAAALTAALALATVTGCTPGKDTPAPATAGPARVTAAVPDGMDAYRYRARQITVTFPKTKAHTAAQRLSRTVDVFAARPVDLVTTTRGDSPVLTVTLLTSASDTDVDKLVAKVHKAVPSALTATATLEQVGVSWTARATADLPASAGRDLSTKLSGIVAGRYAVTVKGRDVTAAWTGTGLTPDGLTALTGAVAQQVGVPTSAVKTSALH